MFRHNEVDATVGMRNDAAMARRHSKRQPVQHAAPNECAGYSRDTGSPYRGVLGGGKRDEGSPTLCWISIKDECPYAE